MQQIAGRERAIGKAPEPTQKLELVLVKLGDVDERLGSSQHREQTLRISSSG